MLTFTKVGFFSRWLLCLVFLLSLVPADVEARTYRGFEEMKAEMDRIYRFPLQPADTSSPQATLKSFITNMDISYSFVMMAYEREKASKLLFTHTEEVERLVQFAGAYFDRAVQCLDLSGTPRLYFRDRSYESCLLLKEILDRVELPPMQDVPGRVYARGPERFLRWRIPGTELRIARVTQGQGRGRYLFTAATVDHLEGYYHRIRSLPYQAGATEGFYRFYSRNPGTLYPPRWAELLPSWLKKDCGDQTLWQWLALGLLILATSLMFLNILRWSVRRREESYAFWRLVARFIPPLLVVGVSFGASYVVDNVINITGFPLRLTLGFYSVIRWLGLAWGTFRLGDFCSDMLISAPGIDREGVDASLVRTLNRLISLGLGLAVLVRGADSMGVSLIPIMTGFGVVGLAFSLAAKPTVENIIGGITLFADRSVRVGEYCLFGDTLGQVQHIGLRSTRILARDRSIVSVPNAEFSQLQLTNLSRRELIPFEMTLGLRYDTPMEKVRQVKARLLAFFEEHKGVDTETQPNKVILEGLGQFSVDLAIKVYVKTGNWLRFQQIREELLFGIVEILEGEDVALAYPSQTVYLEGGLPGPDKPEVPVRGCPAAEGRSFGR